MAVGIPPTSRTRRDLYPTITFVVRYFHAFPANKQGCFRRLSSTCAATKLHNSSASSPLQGMRMINRHRAMSLTGFSDFVSTVSDDAWLGSTPATPSLPTTVSWTAFQAAGNLRLHQQEEYRSKSLRRTYAEVLLKTRVGECKDDDFPGEKKWAGAPLNTTLQLNHLALQPNHLTERLRSFRLGPTSTPLSIFNIQMVHL